MAKMQKAPLVAGTASKAQNKKVRPAPSCHARPNQVNAPGVFMPEAELRRIQGGIVDLFYRPRARCNMTASLLVDTIQERLDELGGGHEPR